MTVDATETIHEFLTLLRTLRRQGRKMREAGLGGRKVSAMRHLLQAGPLTVGQLRDYLYISDSSTSEMVRGLEEAGYVARTRPTEDNRIVIVTLTPAGRAVAREVPLGGVSLLRERLKSLPAAKLVLVREALSELLRLLEIDDEV